MCFEINFMIVIEVTTRANLQRFLKQGRFISDSLAHGFVSFLIFEDTFFVEFKTGALEWSPDLTKEYHNNFINSANEIVQIVSKDLTSNKTSTFCTKKRFIFSYLRSYGVSLFNKK